MSEAAKNPTLSEEQICQIATEALLVVYDSKADLTKEQIVEQTHERVDAVAQNMATVVAALFEYKDPFLQESRSEEFHTMLGTNGLWLIEDCFMHHEDGVDDMEIARRSLSRTSFLGLL